MRNLIALPALLVIFICFRSSAQETGVIIDTTNKYAIVMSSGPPQFKTKFFDSLLKLSVDTSIIRMSAGGDYSMEYRYDILYKKNGTWTYENDRHFKATALNDLPLPFLNKLSYPPGNNIAVLFTGPQRSSAHYIFYYVVIIKGETIKSISISSDRDEFPNNERIESDVNFFKTFNKYIMRRTHPWVRND